MDNASKKNTLRTIIKITAVAVALFIVVGVLLNWVFHRISYSFFINAEQSTEADDRIIKLEIGENASLIGYARSTDYEVLRPAIIYFGGSGDIAYNAVLGKADLFEDYVFISVDYPGTQESAGEMSLASMQLAALQVFDYAATLDFVDAQHIYSMGVSYGTGMATYLASQRDCAKLVLVAPYRDSTDMFPVFKSPFALFLTDKIDTKGYAENVNAPTLIITSDGDKTIDKSICYALSGYFEDVYVFELGDVDHNSLFRDEAAIDEMHRFLKE